MQTARSKEGKHFEELEIIYYFSIVASLRVKYYDFNLQNKKAFITGSTSGIGLAIAQKLEEYGCQVAINSKIKNPLIRLKIHLLIP